MIEQSDDTVAVQSGTSENLWDGCDLGVAGPTILAKCWAPRRPLLTQEDAKQTSVFKKQREWEKQDNSGQ